MPKNKPKKSSAKKAAKKTIKKAIAGAAKKKSQQAKPKGKPPAKRKPVAKPAKPAPKKAPARKKAVVEPEAPAQKPRAGFKKQIARLLNEQKRKILLEVSNKVKNESDESKHEIGDIYDIATVERDRELALILGDMERSTLAEIEDALDRITTGEYGECEECGEPIGEKRLMALPFTRTCVECKSRSEREETLRAKFEEEPGIAMIDRTPIEEEEV